MDCGFNEAVLGLGSNTGDKERHLREAARALAGHVAIAVADAAPLYRTAPQYDLDQDWFLNGALRVITLLDPENLLRELKALERRLGRRETRRYGPREIDLDILLFREAGGRWARRDSETLTLPHPRLAERIFALRPLLDLAERAGWNEAESAPWREALRALESKPGAQDAISPFESAPPPGAGLPRPRPLELATPAATEALGARFGRAARAGEVWALCGPLGTGKTCFARGVARGLGVRGAVQSPTFTLCREYEEGRLALRHWDFYRLADPAEAESAGFFDTLEEEDGVTVVEWAEKFPGLWTFPFHALWLAGQGEGPRRALLRAPEGAEGARDANDISPSGESTP